MEIPTIILGVMLRGCDASHCRFSCLTCHLMSSKSAVVSQDIMLLTAKRKTRSSAVVEVHVQQGLTSHSTHCRSLRRLEIARRFVSLNISLNHSRSLKNNDTIRKLGTVSYSHTVLPMGLSCIISEIKRGIGLKSRFFHIPSAFDAPVTGATVGILP